MRSGSTNTFAARLARRSARPSRRCRSHASTAIDEWVVYCLDKMAIAFAWLGNRQRALQCCTEELAVARATGEPRLLAFALTAKGGVCRAQGDFSGAVDAYEQALPVRCDA